VRANSLTEKNFSGIFCLQAGDRSLVSAADFKHTRQPVSQDQTRKHFLAKFIGLIAAAGLAPKLLARPSAGSPAPVVPAAPFQLHPEARAVARRAESV
jgi:hypothetical protein